MSNSCNSFGSIENCLPGSNWDNCRPWDVETDAVNCYAASIIDETLLLGGVSVNIFKLLGVHEQNTSTDIHKFGKVISSSSASGYSPSSVNSTFNTVWKSGERGSDVVGSSYIGYDFGEVKLANGRNRYGIEANVRKSISTIRIKQSMHQMNRASKIRVERSENGRDWFGVHVANVPDTDSIYNIGIPSTTVPSRYWRIRPIEFNGSDCDSWEISFVEWSEHDFTHVSNVQDLIWLENRNREYAKEPLSMKANYSPISNMMDLSRFGIDKSNQMYILGLSMSQCINTLGRPIVVGDIIEMPNEAMISTDLSSQKLYLEVSSVSWDTSGTVTPGWQYTMLSVTAYPIVASEETQDIVGDKVPKLDASGKFDIFDGLNTNYQDYADASQAIYADANTDVPERGEDLSGTIRQVYEEEILATEHEDLIASLITDKPKRQRNRLYAEDGMPPNGLPYTEGPEYPTNPKPNDYHRLTYEGSAEGILTRLYKFSSQKNRWIYQETDKRKLINNQKNLLDEFTSGSKRSARSIK